MRILTRYVLFDLLKVFALTLTGMTLLIFVVLIGKEFIDKGIGLGPLLKMAPYLLPQAMQFAVPGTMLLATTSVYGRMASYNEIVAIKALGISPMVLVWPTLVLATLVSFVGVVLNDIAVSWGRIGVQNVFVASIEEVAYSQLQLRHSWNLGKFNINVRDVDGHRLIEPTLVVQSTDDRPAITVSAREAELNAFPKEGKLVAMFRDVSVESADINIENPNMYEYVVSLEELTGSSSRTRSPSYYALAEIGQAIDDQQQLITNTEQGMTAQSAFGMMTGDFEPLSDSVWQSQRRELQNQQNRLHRLRIEPWRRWANGFSCLCFVMIGVPVAVLLRFSEFIASFFACFLPILVVYYPLMAMSVDRAKDGAVPPQSVWLGNIVLALAGVWLLRRMNRY